MLLGHPGGPLWTNREEGAWTLPKGELGKDEKPLDAALREFNEETSLHARPPFLPLGSIIQKSGKQVLAWGCRGDADLSKLFSNDYTIQWPRHSGKYITIPEIDRYGWFTIEEASLRMNPAQVPLLSVLVKKLSTSE